MMEVNLNQGSPLNVGNVYEPLYRYYLEQASIDANTPYNLIENEARSFLEHTDEVQRAAISQSEYHPNSDLFLFEEDLPEYDKYLWLIGFQNFYRAVNNLINSHTHTILKEEGADAQYVLGRDAFKYVGHNSLNIERSKKGYASLFYH
ncbi:MAG: hypothetical protein EOO44_21760 [Flavobacterium sp.]|nr:MAG: hypothetical protein EOO44_21760 [Flavobacterium sp.]